jgi:DNA repair protein RadD
MSISLYPHQQDMISGLVAALKNHNRVLLQGPTGVGKTVMAAWIATNILGRGGRVWLVCHRNELLDQTSGTFNAFDIKHGLIASGKKYNGYFRCHIASVETLKNRLDQIEPPNVVVWDEAHHLGAKGWAMVQDALPDAKHIGLSATPQRLDGRGLDRHFDYLVPGPQTAWLIEHGFLAKFRLFSVPEIDRSALHTRMGNYMPSEVEAEMSTPTITGDIIKHWRQHAQDKLTIGFAATINHSQQLAQEFSSAGIPAAHIDGGTNKRERREMLQRFARGEYRVVWNVGLFGEGFDVAANSGMDVTVGAVIDAAPTKSLSMWLQRCGRALRRQDGTAVILDHAGNAMEHGMPNQERTWTLEGKKEKPKPVRNCPECYACHAPMPICPECGFEYPKNSGGGGERTVDHVDGELVEMDHIKIAKEKKNKRREVGMARSLAELQAIGEARGYKPGWAKHVWESRGKRRNAH